MTALPQRTSLRSERLVAESTHPVPRFVVSQLQKETP
jgi:hypothetical protein